MRRIIRPLILAAFVSPLLGTTASADVTAFVGVASEPDTRSLFGFAAGGGFLVVGFEFEYMSVDDDVESRAPSLRTGMGNVYVQNPVPVGGLQFYATIGAGFYRERFGDGEVSISETNFGTNLGGGVKIGLAGPFKLRLDYRVFALQGGARYDNPQRFYAGLTLAF
jgi:opacity protein-like surface antigen